MAEELDDQDQDQEPLTEEQRLERLEGVAQKRRLILIGLSCGGGVLLLFLILGFIIQHLRIRDLEVANETMTTQMETLSQLSDQFQTMQKEMQAFTEMMAGDSGMTPEQRFSSIERKQTQILTVQGNVIETYQAFLLSLARMVRGSRSWSEDFRLYSEQIKEQNKTLRTRSTPATQ